MRARTLKANRHPHEHLGLWILAALLLWLVGYPLALTLWSAFRESGGGWLTGFTLTHWRDFIQHGDEWLALWRSLWISLASVVLSALVGVPLAFIFERTDFPGRRLIGALVALPVALPPLVGVIAFLFLYGESGFIPRALQGLFGFTESPWRLTGAGAILLVHTYSMYVYFYLFTRAALARLDPALPEAAAALGAGRLRTLTRVTLPLLRPALVGAALLTFMTSLASFSAPYIFGGGFRVMTTQIVASKLNGNLAMAQVETVALACLALTALVLMRRLDPQGRLTGSVRGVAPRPRALRSGWARAGASLAGYGLALLLLMPHMTLILISFVPARTWTTEVFPPELSVVNFTQLFSGPEGLRPVGNSLWMAVVATVLAVGLGFAAARGAVRGQQLAPGENAAERRLGGLLENLISLPWAIPGTVFALALATTFAVNAPWLGRFVLVGTPWLLPMAYLVRSLPLTGRASMAGLRQLDPALEEAAAALGAERWTRLRRVVLPLLRPALVAGASLAFITALGDFVTSIVLYTYDNRPISMAIDSILRRDNLGLAAVYGVLLMGVSTLAFVLTRQGEEGI